MTLQQIKDSLPKYRLLTPGVDVWRDGDEFFDIVDLKFDTIAPVQFRQLVNGITGRRPIPDEVIDNQAFWVLYNKLATAPRHLATFELSMGLKGIEVHYERLFKNGAPGFKTALLAEKAIPLLGGEQNIIKHLSAGDLYSKWLGEQLTWNIAN